MLPALRTSLLSLTVVISAGKGSGSWVEDTALLESVNLNIEEWFGGLVTSGCVFLA